MLNHLIHCYVRSKEPVLKAVVTVVGTLAPVGIGSVQFVCFPHGHSAALTKMCLFHLESLLVIVLVEIG